MLKPQDILVLLRLAGDSSNWTFKSLANDLGMSVSETHAALERASESGLYDPRKRKVREHALLELAIHGVPYVFPARRLPRSRGIVTAYSAEPLSGKLVVGDDDRLVWPHPEGTEFGDAIEPLYRSAPEAARRNPKLHRRLALIDALRVGRARERKMAAEALDEELRA
jgi:hypothetical protein